MSRYSRPPYTNNIPTVGIYYLQGTKNTDGTYSFPPNALSTVNQNYVLVDSFTPCQNGGSLGWICDPGWLDNNYSINLVFDNNPPSSYSLLQDDPIITYRSGNYTGNQVLKIAELLYDSQNGISYPWITTIANALTEPACNTDSGIPMWGAQYVSMNEDQSGNIGLIYNLADCDNAEAPNQSYIYYAQRTTDSTTGAITWDKDVSDTNYSAVSIPCSAFLIIGLFKGKIRYNFLQG